MTPAARLQAAIELIDTIIAAAQGNGAAADTIIARYFRERRYAGSKDRQAVRDHVYRAIRAFAEPPAGGRAAMTGLAAHDPDLAALFDGSPHGPAVITADEEGAVADAVPLPAWILPLLPPFCDQTAQAAMLGRAPLHLRANALRTTRAAIIAALPGAVAIDGTRHGFSLPEGTQVEQTDQWQGGAYEVQDAGSQIIAAACAAAPGQTVLDLCAGAGGKTLALAADMFADGDGQGRLVAADVNRDRLNRLRPRGERAGALSIETRLIDAGREAEQLADLAGRCDCVLVDAPCTGMGTWRRNPEARWRLSPVILDRMVRLQSHVLDLAAPLVRPGGTIVYAVCSLLSPEGPEQVAAFLSRHHGWCIDTAPDDGTGWGGGRALSPGTDGTDGFFFARLRKA